MHDKFGAGSNPPLTIAIEAEIPPSEYGGGEQFLAALAYGLGRLTDASDNYVLVCPAGSPSWLARYIGPNQRLITRPVPSPSRRELAKRILGPARRPVGTIIRRALRAVRAPRPEPTDVPVSNGLYESTGAQVIHIAYPLHFFRSIRPTILTIHDLQHRHLPQLFSSEHLAWREALLPIAFSHSTAIATSSHWVKEDVVSQYGVDPSKVHVIPIAPPITTYEQTGAGLGVLERLRLRRPFVLYPALTYAHKNHLGLLEAVALLRDRGNLHVDIVCTGRKKLIWPQVDRKLKELKLEGNVHFPGFVAPADLRALYRLCDFVLLPTLFEGVGLPLLEAFSESVPVACADIPAFREYGGDAVLFFDSTSPEAIARTIQQVSEDAALREMLRQRAKSRSRIHSPEATARGYRALYRFASGNRISEDDKALIWQQVHGRRGLQVCDEFPRC